MSFESSGNKKEVQLPPRESEILALAAKGFTDKQISLELGISRDTVGTYWRRILLRFGASSRTQVVARATEDAVKAKVEDVHRENARLMEEIHSRSEAQARELAQRNLLAAVQEAILNFVSGGPSPENVFDALLSELLSVTQSQFGFIGELKIDEEGNKALKNFSASDISWDEDSKAFYKNSLKDGFLFKNLENLFGAVVHSGSVVISNDPSTDPRRGGIPNGHPVISAFLGLPVMRGDEMLGMIGIANRPGGYSEATVRYLEPLVATCGAIISSLRADELRRQAEREAAETLAQMEALLHGLHSAVLFVDADRRIRFVNAAFCDSFMPGLTPADAIGRTRKEFVSFAKHMSDSKAQNERADYIIANEDSARDERVTMADGRVFLRDFKKVWSGDELLGHFWYFREVHSCKA